MEFVEDPKEKEEETGNSQVENRMNLSCGLRSRRHYLRFYV